MTYQDALAVFSAVGRLVDHDETGALIRVNGEEKLLRGVQGGYEPGRPTGDPRTDRLQEGSMNDICKNCLAELTPQEVQEDFQCEECGKRVCDQCWPQCDDCIEAMYERSYLYDGSGE